MSASTNAGLSAVLSIDTSFVSQKDKKISEVYKDTDLLGRIETLRPQYKEKSFSDDHENWGAKETFVTDMVDIQLLDLIKWKYENSYEKDEQVLVDKDLYKAKSKISASTGWDTNKWVKENNASFNVTPRLSYEASIIRNDILCWIFERMAADMELKIDDRERELDIFTESFSLSVVTLNAFRNLIPSSAGGRLVRIGKRRFFIPKAKQEDDDKQQQILFTKHMDLVKVKSAMMEQLMNAVQGGKNNDYKATYKLKSETIEYEFKFTKEAEGKIKLTKTGLNDDSEYKPFKDWDSNEWKKFSFSKSNGIQVELEATVDEVATPANIKHATSATIICNIAPDIQHVFEKVFFPASLDPFQKNLTIAATIKKMLDNIKSKGFPKRIWDSMKNSSGETRLQLLMDLGEVGEQCVALTRAVDLYNLEKYQRQYERLADCAGTVPVILKENMAYLAGGHHLNGLGTNKIVTKITE